MSLWLNIFKTEWLFVILSAFLVLFTEVLNTTIEKLLDFIEPQYHTKVKNIKDISSAFVLITAINALIVAVFIFSAKVVLLF